MSIKRQQLSKQEQSTLHRHLRYTARMLFTLLCSDPRTPATGAARACGGTSGYQACTSANYGSGFETVEVTCDGLDND